MRSHLPVVVSVITAWGSCCIGVAMPRDCGRDLTSSLGVQLGRAIRVQVKTFTELGLHPVEDVPDCEREDLDRSSQRACRTLADIDSTLETINDAFDKGCLKEGSSYKRSIGPSLFSTLLEGVSPDEPKVAPALLERMLSLCEDGSLLPDNSEEGCRHAMEQGALLCLSERMSPVAHRVALHVFDLGYVSQKAKLPLEQFLSEPNDDELKLLAKKILNSISRPTSRGQ